MDKKSNNQRLSKIREQIKGLPANPGLYFFKDAAEKVLYIGKAKNLRSRTSSYFQPSADLAESRGPKIADMINKTDSVSYLETETEVEAMLKEARLIKDIRPPYNTELTDDKTFPYLEITTSDDFPGVYITRKPSEKGTRLFGPFAAVNDLREVLVLLQKIFLFRTCKLEIKADDDKRRFFRPCLLFSIKQCTAPCADRITKQEYRKIITSLTQFLRSKRSTVLRKLRQEMSEAADALEYEKAAQCRNRIRLIENLELRGSPDEHVQPEVFASDPAEAMEKLQKLFAADEPIRIIEGIDIAHIAGAESVGSLVKFIDGRAFKAGYRKFRIKTIEGIDDYAMISEVVSRRYKYAVKGEELWPDLILIDGGIGQLRAAQKALGQLTDKKITIASIAKKEELIFTTDSAKPLKLARNNPALKLLQYVRDEAHRFAQHYHHILRKKNLLQ